MKKISEHIPTLGKELALYKGKDLIGRLGENTIKELVCNILCGQNVRSSTEALTRKRLALSNAALLVTYLNASKSIKDFSKNLPKLVGEEIKEKSLTKEEKLFLQWLVGLTGKSVQNVLRDSDRELVSYLDEVELALRESAGQSKKIFGDLTGEVKIGNESKGLNWPVLTQIFMAIGAQTLAIRGSEKSMYGKLFEKLVLGALLSILGFKFHDKTSEAISSEKIFWLSEQGDKRESDATLLYKKGVGVRFDIGFIGRGNPEISLDKVSRFESEMQYGNQKHYMTTIIIVDRIGKGSRIVEMAREINGHIVQMSMSFWVKEIVQILSENIGFEHNLLIMQDIDVIRFIKSEMEKISLKSFT